MDGNIGADVLQHAQGVLGGVVDRGVPGDGRDGEQLEPRVERREHDRDRVVRARVDVEDELRQAEYSPSSTSKRQTSLSAFMGGRSAWRACASENWPDCIQARKSSSEAQRV